MGGGGAPSVGPRAPPPSRNPLLDEPRVVVTPHIGGATAETIERGVAMVAEEITRLSAGLAPVHAR